MLIQFFTKYSNTSSFEAAYEIFCSVYGNQLRKAYRSILETLEDRKKWPEITDSADGDLVLLMCLALKWSLVRDP